MVGGITHNISAISSLQIISKVFLLLVFESPEVALIGSGYKCVVPLTLVVIVTSVK